MQQILSALVQALRKGLLILVLFGGFSLPIWFSLPHAFSYAAPTVTQNSQAIESREEAYEEAKEIAEDPKRGIEKEYEKNVEEYLDENPQSGGLVQEAKSLVQKATGQDK